MLVDEILDDSALKQITGGFKFYDCLKDFIPFICTKFLLSNGEFKKLDFHAL